MVHWFPPRLLAEHSQDDSQRPFQCKLDVATDIIDWRDDDHMVIAALIARQLFGLVLSSERKVQAFILSLLVAESAAGVYIYIALKLRLAKTTRLINGSFTPEITHQIKPEAAAEPPL